jgi:hypothetical protein
VVTWLPIIAEIAKIQQIVRHPENYDLSFDNVTRSRDGDTCSCIIHAFSGADYAFIVKYHPRRNGSNWLHAKRAQNMEPNLNEPIRMGTAFYEWLRGSLPRWQLPQP